jgi:hypothetical protein
MIGASFTAYHWHCTGVFPVSSSRRWWLMQLHVRWIECKAEYFGTHRTRYGASSGVDGTLSLGQIGYEALVLGYLII